MDKKHKYLKRFLAFVLSAAMVITYMPATMLAYAAGEDESQKAQTVTEQPAAAAPAEETQPAADEPAPTETPAEETPVAEEQAPKEASADTAGTDADAKTESDVNDSVRTDAEDKAADTVSDSDKASDSAEQKDAQVENTDADAADNAKAEDVADAEKAEEDAAEKDEYAAQDFEASVSGVDVKVHAPQGALPDGTTMKAAKVGIIQMSQVKSAVKEELGKKSKVVKAVDITFYDNDGNEIQPQKAVEVSFESTEFEEIENPAVIHFGEDKKAEKLEEGLIRTDGNEVAFDANRFSVYAVIEEVVPRLTVKFKNGDTDIAEMYVKGSDTASEVEDIINDPGAGAIPEKQVFKGWTTDQNYTADSELMTIDEVRSAAKTKAGSITEDETVTYYAALFKQYSITYVDDTKVRLGAETVEVPATTSEGPYTVNMGYVVDDTHNFEGWKSPDDYGNITIPTGATKDTLFTNGTEITVAGDVEFVVSAPAGFWLVFNENGKGATYNAPQFVKNGDVTSDEKLITMTRKGYTFDGWYTGAPETEGGDPTGNAFAFGGELTANTTIYAKWKTATTANYTVIIWKQGVDGGEDYDFAESISLSGTPNTVINTVRQSGTGDDAYAIVNERSKTYEGFHLNKFDQNVTITPEGNAILNVYYDRNTYTLRFFYARSYTYNGHTYVQVNCNNEGFLYHLGGDLNSSLTYIANRSYDYRRDSNSNTWKDVNNGSINNNPKKLVSSEYLGKTEVDDGTMSIRGATDVISNNGQSTRQTVNMTYYYLDVEVLYGQSLQELWPVPNNTFISQEMTRYNLENGNYGTIRPLLQGAWATRNNIGGMYAKMDMDLFESGSNTAYFLTYWRFENYYNYQYNVYFSALEGEQGGDIYKGDRYILQSDKSYTVANGQGWGNTTETDSGNGFYDVSTVTFDGVTKVGRVDNQNARTINVYYKRDEYNINYEDGIYVDGDNKEIDETSEMPSSHVKVPFAQDLSSYNKGGAHYYKPSEADTPEGYVFEGWYMDSEGEHPYTFTTMPQHDITVYAKWRQIQYRVFLHPNAGTSETDPNLSWGKNEDGTEAEPAMTFRVSYGGKISAPTGLRPGYEFFGWYTDEACTQAFPHELALNKSTVSAAYNKATEYTDPMDKWGVLGDNPFNSDTVDKEGQPIDRFWITQKYELWAKWSKVLDGATGINITYDANGGDNPPVDGALHKDNSRAAAGAASTPPENKKFAAWVLQTWDEDAGEYVDKKVGGKTVELVPGQSYEVLAADAKVEPAADGEGNIYTIKLKAKYDDIEESVPTHIYWYKNDGNEAFHKDTTAGSDNHPLKINEAVGVQGALTRTGYKFLGWAKVDEPETITEAYYTQDLDEDDLFLFYNESDDKFYAEAAYTNEVTQVAADEKDPYESLFAVWKPITYTVKFNKKAADATGTMADLGFEYDEEKALTKNTFTRSGYTFTGWNTEAGGGGTAYTDEKVVKNLTSTDGDEITLYAQWRANNYTVTWKNEDGTVLETDENVAYGATPEYNGETPTKAATAQYTYTFAGWMPEVSAVTGDATYTATYTKTVNTYTVTWKNEDGTVLETDENVAYGTTPEYNGETPTKAATAQYTYTFKEWTPKISTVTGDATYTATYTETVNKYTITWVNEDGTVLETDRNVDYGATPEYNSETPTKAATAQYTYTFAGWTPEVSEVTGDATYTAAYKRNGVEYTVTYEYTGTVPDGAPEVPEAATYKYGDKVPAATVPTMDGYTFSGWNGEVSTMPAENVTVTGSWTAVEPEPTPTPAVVDDDDDDDDDNPGGGGGNPGGGGNNAGGGGAPAVNPAVVPAPVVPDNPVPQVEPEPQDIPDDPTPLAPAEGTWALLNLIAAALTTVGAGLAVFRKKEEDDEDEEAAAKKQEDDEDEEDHRARKMAIAKGLGVAAAAASIITFILTEDMSLPMAMTDKWTLLMALFFAGQAGTAVANKKASELDDEDEEEEGAEA